MRPVPQPAKGELARRRISNRFVARGLNVNEHYVGRVLNGWQRPSPRLVEYLSRLLDLPADELFRVEDLSPLGPAEILDQVAL